MDHHITNILALQLVHNSKTIAFSHQHAVEILHPIKKHHRQKSCTNKIFAIHLEYCGQKRQCLYTDFLYGQYYYCFLHCPLLHIVKDRISLPLSITRQILR